MARKDFSNVTNLAALAGHLPTQKPTAQPVAVVAEQDTAPTPPRPVAAAPASTEETVQFSFGLRKSQRRQLAQLAGDADMTVRAFILDALKAKGLDVKPEDLDDLRKQRGR
jgi:hypothetical protein